ncbi:DNA sulfur modification protein DndB [Streptomyces sp. NPDC006274]|uniref:DNA sulfur modification protein DndB n=1 Tax=unclassified Streptomyces TaxID=2593676 RepID=UPI0033BDF22A
MTPKQNSELDLALLKQLKAPIKFQKIGTLTMAGTMQKISFSATYKEIAERFNFDRLLSRRDFDVESEQAGNREIAESHWKKIAESLMTDDRPFVGTLTVALGPDPEHVNISRLSSLGEGAELVELTVRESAPNPLTEDGQHRIMALLDVWKRVKDSDDPEHIRVRKLFETSSATIEMLLEDDPHRLAEIFVRMASTRRISASLIAVMDMSTLQNRLGTYVMKHSELFSNRSAYLGAKAARALAEKKGREFEDLYPAAAVRNAAASIAGVGLKDRTPEQREKLLEDIVGRLCREEKKDQDVVLEEIGRDVVALIDYAYKCLPGWKEMKRGVLTAKEFKDIYLHGSAAGLYTVANVIAAARQQGVSPHVVIDELAKLPWRKDALRSAKNHDGEEIKVHMFFEGTLAITTWDSRRSEWRSGPAGGTRSVYNAAIEKVLSHLGGIEGLGALGVGKCAVDLGLTSETGQRGRPARKKTA